MQNELIYPSSRFKALLLFIGCLAFVALGWWISTLKPLIGWSCVVFFGLGIPISTLMMLPNKVYLRLNKHGFAMVSPFNKKFVRWNDVERFYIGSVRGTKLIAIVYKPGYLEQQVLRKLSSSVARMEGAVPNSYTASREEILKNLNDWHARYARPNA